MTTHSFPALGFDPAPGEPDVLERLGADCTRFAAELHDDAGRVRVLSGDFVWSGRAAEAFRHRLADLPRDLDNAADAYRQAGSALSRFSGELREHQRVAVSLEQQAEQEEVEKLLEHVRAAGCRLRQRVQEDARSCERALHAATANAPRPAGWFRQVADRITEWAKDANAAVGRFVRDHAAVISTIAGIASKVSSALAVIAVIAGPIPILGQAVASIAIAGSLTAAGIALVGHTALAVYAGGSWTPVLLDAAALITGGAGKGVEAIGGRVAAARGLQMTPDAFHGLRGAVGVLRQPAAAWAASARATMTMPTLVTRTVSYQFDLAGGAIGTADLAMLGSLPHEVREAEHLAHERADDLASSGLSVESELGYELVGAGPSAQARRP